MKLKHKPVLVRGEDNLACSIAVCMLNGGHPVVFVTGNKDAQEIVDRHLAEHGKVDRQIHNNLLLEITTEPVDAGDCALAIIVAPEDRDAKVAAIREVRSMVNADAIIAVNAESIPVSRIQEGLTFPERVIGLNWSDPAHTTFFLEIITNGTTGATAAEDIAIVAKEAWHKDPYVLTRDRAIRSRMLAAMVREAFFLVDSGYVAVEDIDRACRNDPGYYLPFAGNCRYIDLMGTYQYGKVMEDLNPELSKETRLPEFFTEMVKSGAHGMQSGKGFYTYGNGEAEQRTAEFRAFSYEIRDIISRYPFRYLVEKTVSPKKVSSGV